MRFLTLALLLAASVARGQAIAAFPSYSGDRDSLCTTHEATQICRTEASGEAEVTVTRDGREVARWSVSHSGQAGTFAAFETDLDRDGKRDLLVATLEAVSNGLAVSYWRVDVLSSGDATPAYSFTVEDFDARGRSFAHDGSRLVLWATDWAEGPDPRGRRPNGMYITGRPFFLSSTGLLPARGLPLRARRLLNSFARDDSGPVGWLSNRRAQSLRTDMALAGCRQSHEQVQDLTIREGEDDYGNAVTTFASGEREWQYGANVAGNSFITNLGDSTSGRLFPMDYRPLGLAERLGGTHRLTTCASGEWAKARVLWL